MRNITLEIAKDVLVTKSGESLCASASIAKIFIQNPTFIEIFATKIVRCRTSCCPEKIKKTYRETRRGRKNVKFSLLLIQLSIKMIATNNLIVKRLDHHR